MRWWLGILGFLLAVGIALTVFRRSPPTDGQRLAKSLVQCGVALRPAIPLLDYTPPTLGASTMESGVGGLYGGALSPVYNQRWIRAKDTDFLWQRVLGGKSEEEPLRKAIATEARDKVRRALAMVAPDGAALDAALATAFAKVNELTDEQLLLAWLAADEGVLAEAADLGTAAYQGLLLAARVNEGPAIVFRTGADDVYLLPLDGRSGPTSAGGFTWIQMEAYDGGRLAWTGVMSMAGAREPDAVRRMAARMAAEVNRAGPWFR